jgi:hypothetical protein
MLLSTGARLALTAAFALSCVLLAAPAGAAWQDIPDSISLQRMGDQMVVNGTPMAVRAFNTSLPAEQVVQLVQNAWERNKDRTSVTRTSMGPWTILNQTVGSEHRSFQIKSSKNGGFEGFVALTSPALARQPKPAIRLPAEVTALQIIDSVDNGRSSQQIIAVSTRSIEATSAALEASLKASGWERHVMKKDARTVVFAANRTGQEFDAILTAEKRGSMVMVNTAEQTKK